MNRLKFGEFTCLYTYQYFNKNKPSKRPPRTYSHTCQEIYIENEEDKVWDKILSDLGNSPKKKVKLSNKKIVELADFGYTYYGNNI